MKTPKSLTKDNFAYSEDGNRIITQAYNWSMEIITIYMEQGYSPREIAHALMSGISLAEAEQCICSGLKKLQK